MTKGNLKKDSEAKQINRIKSQFLDLKTSKFFKLASLFLVLIMVLTILTIGTVKLIFNDKFFPNIYIGDVNASFLTKNQAFYLLNNKISSRVVQPLTLRYKEQTFTLNLSTSTVDYPKLINVAFGIGHTGSLIERFQQQIQILVYPIVFTPDIKLDLGKQVEKISKKVTEPPQDAIIWLDNKNQILVKPGQDGIEIDKERLEILIKNYIAFGTGVVDIPVKKTAPGFSENEAMIAKKALEVVQTSPIKLVYDKNEWSIDVPTLYYFLDTSGEQNELLDQSKVSSYVLDIALKINQPVQEPLFKFEENVNKVTAFRPPQDGRELDIKQTISLIENSVQNPSDTNKELQLPVNVVKPKLENVGADNLGIKSLLGGGVSNFAGSIENRIYNVKLTASKINGVLIPPGETFSFDKTVGDITAATGFKQAYVIKSGRTVLDDGGGVCQDSTTLFRAILNAGLPITERTAHAYRVGYYEQGGFPPGLDATIFYPTVDLKFKNDTSSYILIQSHTEGTTLYVDLYGTPDGRVTKITTPVVTNRIPAPPELRQDDPTLPRGTVKQVDWAASGAKVSFNRTVVRNGETIINETWNSNYRPWQAVYLVGTK